jgi:hypothetical protein
MRVRLQVVLTLILLLTGLHTYGQCKPIGSLPVSITVPGTYCLTTDLSVANSVAVAIYASNVTLDLQGFRLSSTGSSGYGVYSYNGYSNLVIRNGQITASYRGIYVETANSVASNVVVQDLVVDGFSDSGVWVNAVSSSIHDVEVRSPSASIGIHATGADIDRVHVYGAFTYGIDSESGAARTIHNSVVEGVTTPLYAAGGGSVNVVDCDLVGTGYYGLVVGGGKAVIIANRIRGALAAILFVGSTGMYRDNVFLSSQGVSGSGTNLGNNT